ncbi:DUF6186 family protein [Mumia flava]|uniref:DUF6186 family protein n=1 Tax=Mumia flava TaxID=1348852 RepID=UPI0012FE2C6F|nr:DUF6186 family protein [Mumia flava]
MSPAAIVAGYLAVLAAGVVLTVAGRTRPDAVAPLGEVLDVGMASRGLRFVVLTYWWWLGWHVLAGPTII